MYWFLNSEIKKQRGLQEKKRREERKDGKEREKEREERGKGREEAGLKGGKFFFMGFYEKSRLFSGYPW